MSRAGRLVTARTVFFGRSQHFHQQPESPLSSIRDDDQSDRAGMAAESSVPVRLQLTVDPCAPEEGVRIITAAVRPGLGGSCLLFLMRDQHGPLDR